MDRIPLSKADGHMAELIDRVENGEEIVILRDGKPAVKLVLVVENAQSEGVPTGKPPIRFGFAKGRIRIADDFDAPLPDDLLKSFYGLAPDEEWPDQWKGMPG
ncbi:type II toxin-antitoxin system prevent-host-death family antitoxin [Azospirillum sp. INR13]|uniref:type II toxin-antitoxin system Phd/YefM family antitoxin n=1 Tax=Azospirillum sp. INR13 TaxID=2596919 RepID=UPI0018927180|nr:type II toxin-antitoxin system prevent-host-death family antitoxin [Azospirillum sp. INR13]MBF5095056.1 type II toxin-antitoxin system prevent-host-death family antitoxin [Azospirillum sp. INR13]